jgi:hypothetical protein
MAVSGAWDEPAEWHGRGRPDWHSGESAGTGTHRLITSHRDADELGRQARWMGAGRTDELEQRPAPASPAVGTARPIVVTMPERDPVERLALWLEICRSVVAIVALLALLTFCGYAWVHGGWPMRLLGG